MMDPVSAHAMPAPRKNLAVGHFYNAPFREACAPFLPRIAEVFFAWPGVLSCRPAPTFTPEVRERLLGDLRWARENGLRLDTLFNANCYGDEAMGSSRTSSPRPRRSSRASSGSASPACASARP